MTSIKEF